MDIKNFVFNEKKKRYFPHWDPGFMQTSSSDPENLAKFEMELEVYH